MKLFCQDHHRRKEFFPAFLIILWLTALGSLGAQTSRASSAEVEVEASAGRSAGITFCAYNVRNYLKMDRHVGGVLTPGIGKPDSEIAVVLRSLVTIKADVLGICEIGDEADVLDLQRRLREQGINYPHYELSHGGDRTRGLVLLSKWPIVKRQSQKDLRYDIGGQIFPMQRGILDVTVETGSDPEDRLRFLGIHLKSKRAVPEADEMLMRRNEAHLLRQYIERVLSAEPQTRLLVYGDFNENAHEAPIKEIEGPTGNDFYLRDIKAVDTRGQTWTHYWEFADVYSRFDYVFVNKALFNKIDREKSYVLDVPDFIKGSDHRPVVVRVRGGK